MQIRALALIAVLLVSACKKDEPRSTRWDQAASSASVNAATNTAPTAAAAPTVAGSGAKTHGDDLNKFFPADGIDGMKRVFTDESKKGTSIAKLTKDGKDVAVISVNDAQGDESALKKFETASEKVQGYPTVKVGNNQTAALVNKRYQVKVSSPTLDHEARKTWVQKFDLAGLNSLAEGK